jgi:lipid-A-disaccharide synthase
MKLLISAGEASGDQRGAEVLEALKKLFPSGVEAFGLGGNKLAASGMRVTHNLRCYSVMGFGEILSSLGKFLALERNLKALCLREKPDCLLLVDYPGFNMRLGRWAKKNGFPVVHYVAPQMWAWGSWRAASLRKSTDILLTLFPFEETFFRERGIKAVFTGHPLTALIQQVNPGGRALGLLPGSRAQEVEKLLPVMIEAFCVLREKGIADKALLAVSDHLNMAVYRNALEIPGIEPVDGAGKALAGSRAALVCSGTATLETALYGVPFVVCYKTGFLNYALAKYLVKGVNRIGLANIIAGEDVAPELIQKDMTALNMVKLLEPCFISDTVYADTRKRLSTVRKTLGEGNPAENAAGEILRFLKETSES